MSIPESDPAEAVRWQYENYPFPPRDPEEERQQLKSTYLDRLGTLNHYCFGGRKDFRHGFRALVAGGGTGDSVIMLAEQLRNTDARIVYLDVSRPAMQVRAIAQSGQFGVAR